MGSNEDKVSPHPRWTWEALTNENNKADPDLLVEENSAKPS
jgi:hypothetical protein